MKTRVARADIQSARRMPLASFIERHHRDDFRRTGSSLYLKANKSLYIRDGHSGYTDFSTGDHGNSIDFLVNYLGYSFVGAVHALNGEYSRAGPGFSGFRAFPDPSSSARQVRLPQAADKPYRRMYAYLKKRGIPTSLAAWMEGCGLVYQEKEHGNIVFVNTQKDYCELRGTLTYTDKPFHGCLKSAADRFWAVSGGPGKIQTAYICEAALDAVSLLLLHRKRGFSQSSLYVSIGGVSNQKTIQRIKAMFPAVLAVDHDPAGDACRKQNPDLPFILPVQKDWNDDLRTSLKGPL